MSDDLKGLLLVVGGVAALIFLVPMLFKIVGFVLGIAQFAMGLLWLALIVAAVIFVIGLVRKLIRG
jgi:hypothetical protein